MNRRTLLAAGLAATLAGCATTPTGPTVTVFAAASLKAAFTDLAATFGKAHPGTAVVFNFAGSQVLAEQLVQGARADALATADVATMGLVVRAGLASDAHAFASNRLIIAVPPGNPARIEGLADLARSGVRLVTCSPAVPCGAAAARVQHLAGVAWSPVSQEQAVSDVVAKVRAGEADAGLVYRTDVIASSGALEGIDFPESTRAATSLEIVALRGDQPALGAQFVDLVLSTEGRAVLHRAGFGSA